MNRIYYKANKPKWNKYQKWGNWCDVSKISPSIAPKKKRVYKPIQEFRQEQIDNQNVYELKAKGILDEMGIKYEYQKVYGPYILDFYLPDFRVDLEMDGHHHKARKAKDKKRSKWLYRKRIFTVRFWNYALSKPEAFKSALMDRLKNYSKRPQVQFDPEPEPLDWMTKEFRAVVG